MGRVLQERETDYYYDYEDELGAGAIKKNKVRSGSIKMNKIMKNRPK